MKFSTISAAAFAMTLHSSADAACREVTTVAGLDLDEFTRASWFVQAQQVVQFQPLENLFCLTATYTQDNPSVPFFSGATISVENYGNEGGINGPSKGGPLCGRLPDESVPSKLLVAPCFLPNFLAGDYFVVGLGLRLDSSYEWALISGGQPDVEFEDGCTFKDDGSTVDGLFLLSRDQVLSEESLADAAKVAKEQGITMQRMVSVPQSGCEYQDAELKMDLLANSRVNSNSTLLEMAKMAAAQDCSKLYKIENNECGEVCLSSTIAPFAVQFGGVSRGTCADQGYTVFARTETVSVGPFGNFDTDLYTM